MSYKPRVLAVADGGTGVSVSNPVIQVIRSNIRTVVTCSTNLPCDNSIPQITEGSQVLTATITPKNSSNILMIEFFGYGSSSADEYWVTALFQDANSNALVANAFFSPTGAPALVNLVHYMTAGTTSATTFQIRLGSGTATFYINGDGSGTGYFGGVSEAVLIITEYTS